MLALLFFASFLVFLAAFAFFCRRRLRTARAAFFCSAVCALLAAPWLSVGALVSLSLFFYSAFFSCPLCLALVFFAGGLEAGEKPVRSSGAPCFRASRRLARMNTEAGADALRRRAFAVCGLSVSFLMFFFPFSADASPGKKHSLPAYTAALLASASFEPHSLVYHPRAGTSDWLFRPGRIAESFLLTHQMRLFVSASGGKISAEISCRRQGADASTEPGNGSPVPAFSVRSLSASHIIPLPPHPADFAYTVTRLLEGTRPVQLISLGNGLPEGAGGYALLPDILRAAGYEVRELSSADTPDPSVPLLVAGLPSFARTASGKEKADAAPQEPARIRAGQGDPQDATNRTPEAFAARMAEFAGQGGSAVFFASPVLPDAFWTLRDHTEENSAYFDFLASLGAEILPETLYNDTADGGWELRLVSGDGRSVVSVAYPFWLTVSPSAQATESGNAAHPVFSGVRTVRLLWPAALQLTQDFPASAQTYRAARGQGSVTLARTESRRLSSASLPFAAAPFSEGLPALVAAAGHAQSQPANGNRTDAENSGAGRAHGFFLATETEAGKTVTEAARKEDAAGNRPPRQRTAVFSDCLFLSDLQELALPNDNARVLVNCADWLWERDGLLAMLSEKSAINW